MDNYIFIRVVGQGSYGEVNLVKHRTDRKQYVIKKLNLTTSSKRERRAAEQEAQLLSQLRHPNIVTYRESWEGTDLQLYIVMGFCEGGDLYHRLKQQKGELLPERQVVEWFVQIAMALQYLHERNILHRDLKTQNIFLTKTNIIKVGDLGIARVLENQNDMASTLIGTPYYMSPELFSNKPYNHKSDVWALGCCVYEMSTLKHAFNAKDMNSLVYRIVEGRVGSIFMSYLPQMPSKYDPQLGELIKSMLCKRPDDRPDVKLILRQPYIKRQIAMFLEATKEITAKSRKKVSGGSRYIQSNDVANVAQLQPKPKPLPPSPQLEPLPRLKQKDKSQLLKNQNGVTDCNPLQINPPPKPSSPDALKSSITSMASISNIQVDMCPQQDPDSIKRALDAPQLAVAQHQAEKKEPLTPSTHVKPPLKPVSAAGRRGVDDRKVLNGFCPFRDTFSVSEKKVSANDDKDDTMELLKDAYMPNSKVEMKQGTDLEKRSTHRITLDKVEENIECKNDSMNPVNRAQTGHADIQDNLESTEKLLQPFSPTVEPPEEKVPLQINSQSVTSAPFLTAQEPAVSLEYSGRDIKQTDCDQQKTKAASRRPLPLGAVEPSLEVRKKNTESKKMNENVTSKSCGDGLFNLPKERPLSARERRRLRHSQDTACQSGAVRASHDVTGSKTQHQNTPVSNSVSDFITRTNKRGKDEDEYSSSTSSTEHAEGDCRERRAETKDMQDLVHMMTKTLRMVDGNDVNEVDKHELGCTLLPEFKLNKKYRDTLVLHGKARQEAENLSLGEIPIGSTSGPAKIRRAIELLRTDVVKGLGVKLLGKVLEIMEEEDDDKLELCLRQQMGDEKYHTYGVMCCNTIKVKTKALDEGHFDTAKPRRSDAVITMQYQYWRPYCTSSLLHQYHSTNPTQPDRLNRSFVSHVEILYFKALPPCELQRWAIQRGPRFSSPVASSTLRGSGLASPSQSRNRAVRRVNRSLLFLFTNFICR
ncbi:serine/threonine-protein kinase Nek4 isoform X3 [Phyllopteryx taeniolatus]|uniref:serine/threonine-protein kinase Nek4 isoform X3 n=1 Tax=Phyllopteryx taeniolatus TaxID=161469 RepID=UPI002AD5ACBC|nr:serine/threonine-protein kinase Nek4 isoform X3 [Phyllopteryx taeniolatus]